jgi:hypothetical protein
VQRMQFARSLQGQAAGISCWSGTATHRATRGCRWRACCCLHRCSHVWWCTGDVSIHCSCGCCASHRWPLQGCKGGVAGSCHPHTGWLGLFAGVIALCEAAVGVGLPLTEVAVCSCRCCQRCQKGTPGAGRPRNILYSCGCLPLLLSAGCGPQACAGSAGPEDSGHHTTITAIGRA